MVTAIFTNLSNMVPPPYSSSATMAIIMVTAIFTNVSNITPTSYSAFAFFPSIISTAVSTIAVPTTFTISANIVSLLSLACYNGYYYGYGYFH